MKDALSGLRQFLPTGTPLEMMKNDFYFTSKALFVLKIFKFLSWPFGHVSKRLDIKDKVNFKFYDVTARLTNNRNTHISQYLEKQTQSDNETWSVTWETFFLKNHTQNLVEKLALDPFLKYWIWAYLWIN